MKLVFAFVVLAVVASAGLAEKSPQSAVESAVQAAGRAVREAAQAATPKPVPTPAVNKGGKAKKSEAKGKKQKSGKGKKSAAAKSSKGGRKNKSKKNGKKSAKAGKKSVKGGKKKAKKSKSNKKNGNKKPKGIKKSHKAGKKGTKFIKIRKPAERQTASCGVADVVAAIKKFTLYTTNLNQNKRIRGFVSLSQQKMVKASTTFATAAAVMWDASSNGNTCNGGPANSSVSTVNNKLQNCNVTAAAVCNVSLTLAENATVTLCAASLTNYTTAFQACVANGSCSCFKSLANLSAACENQSAILTPVTAKKNQCVGPSTSGSFADCRQQQMAAIPYTTGCKCPSGAVTTRGPTVTTKAVGRMFRNREFFKFNKIHV